MNTRVSCALEDPGESFLRRLVRSQFPSFLATGKTDPITGPIIIHDADHALLQDADDWRDATVTLRLASHAFRTPDSGPGFPTWGVMLRS